jgi:hypothetical protein
MPSQFDRAQETINLIQEGDFLTRNDEIKINTRQQGLQERCSKRIKCVASEHTARGVPYVEQLETLIRVFQDLLNTGHAPNVRGTYVWLHACRAFLERCADNDACASIVKQCIVTKVEKTIRRVGDYKDDVKGDYKVVHCGECNACTKYNEAPTIYMADCTNRQLHGKALGGATGGVMMRTVTWRLFRRFYDQFVGGQGGQGGQGTKGGLSHRSGYQMVMMLFRCLMHSGGARTLKCLRGACACPCKSYAEGHKVGPSLTPFDYTESFRA